jgi:hypothetical protein
METKHNTKLLIKVLALGVVIAILGYLLHPDVKHLSVLLNGQPIIDSLVFFDAIPTFLVVIGLTAILTVLLFFGIGLFVFFGFVFVALAIVMIIAPYFSPVLAIIALIIALMSFNHH